MSIRHLLLVARAAEEPDEADPAEAPEAKPTRVVASTATPDRAHDIVEQSWRLDAFLANPVILANHDSREVVGRAVRAAVVAGALEVDIEWDEDETCPMGIRLASQFRRGFRRAVSVGFIPHRVELRSALDEGDPRWGASGLILGDNELLELSAVAIPMNAEAVARAVAPGVPAPLLSGPAARSELLEWLREVVRTDDQTRAAIAAVLLSRRAAPPASVPPLAHLLRRP